MGEITPQELLGQLRGFVEILGAEPAEQLAWLDAHRYPVAEMWDQLADAAPGWFPRLEQHGQITEAGKAAVMSLLELLDGYDNPALWEDDPLSLQEPEWHQIRERARSVLEVLSTNLASSLEMDDEVEFEIEPVGLDIRPADE